MAEEEVVGPVFGPVSDLPVSALGYTSDGVQWDYAIGGLTFMDAAGDDHPYARETAQFRKDQVDQSRTVGDQSLTGYWTRGQLSFHRGAGIAYLELLESEAVINRFTDSRNVDPWEPGVVTVKAPHTTVSTDQIQDALLFDTGFVTLSLAGGLSQRDFDGSVDSPLPSSDGNPISSIATDGVNLYAINDDKVEKCEPGGSFAALWTGTGLSLTQVFWAKSRLWVVDDAGEWWTLSTAGGTFTSGDSNSLWKSSIEDADWSLTDAPNGAYLSAKNTVYLSTWAASTADLTVPSSVASVGAQETIGNLGFYLGYLFVFSDKGARMGLVRDDQVVLGDKFLSADFSGLNRVAYRDSLVLAVGAELENDSAVLYELNPLDQTSDLVPAWAPVRDVDEDSGECGSLVFPSDLVLTFCGAGSINIDDATLGDATGYVTTAYHRFGTLEPKDFRNVSVRVEGNAGSVGVEVVRADGTSYSIVTLGPNNFSRNEIDLRLPTVVDAIGLRFTLTAEDGVSPRLLGYQLRAVPAPPRQRLIQIALKCFDTEKVGTVSRGKRGRAYRRLAALEELERTSGVVRYQDFITGEVGQVVVENVSFRRTTPASASTKANWGGFIVVTLRKVG